MLVWANIMEVWKEFEANQLTHSAAHYLVAVHDILGDQGYVRSADIAKKLGIARSSASMGLHALIEKGYLKEDANKFLKLTPKGQQVAKEIIGKKVVLKRFFQDILKVDPYQAEVDTCKIEHLISSETGANLLTFIQFMSSQDPQVKKVLDKFFQLSNSAACPGLKSCTVCETVCLKEMLPTKLRVVPSNK
ncbi:MAG: metal-dependent transcriptional regulator [Deltaproteobacteria bacterium]|nr:metal-dependent transcriptional regulator [Deltaproteobacteria bacterium]